MTAKKSKPPAKQPRADWEAIEREYRAGQLSIRQIARQFGVTDAGVRWHAKQNKWTRDLTAEVQNRIRDDLVRTSHPAKSPLSDEAIVDYAAARGVEVVRQHRDHLGRMQRIAMRLAGQLELLLSGKDPEVSFLGFKESPSDVLNKIAQATARWMPLERQAFGLDKHGDDDDAPKPATPGIDWRDLFAKAGIIEASADGGTGGAAPQSDLRTSVGALPSD